MTVDREALTRFVRQHGIRVRWPEELTGVPPADDPAHDFGRWIVRVPGAVIAPRDERELLETMAWLAARGQPYTFRGGGHSSGGQALHAGGVVIDLRALHAIHDDDPAAQLVHVGGGITWQGLLAYLAPRGRRPRTLTSSFGATVAGTLAVGGFGDTTHLYGLTIDSVHELTLITPDARRHVLRPGDELFDYTLAGRGQLGAIVAAKLATLPRTLEVAIRALIWDSLFDHLRDALVVSQLAAGEFLRARLLHDGRRWRVHGMLGALAGDEAPAPKLVIDALRPAAVSEPGRISLVEHLRDDETAWTTACPAVELTLPLPRGVDDWEHLAAELDRLGMIPYLAHGISVMVVPRSPLPLAPVPSTPYSMMLAIRPRVPLADAERVAGCMREIAAGALARGARLYMMSVEPGRDVIARQYGAAWTTWRALKQRLDPGGVCNPGLLGS